MAGISQSRCLFAGPSVPRNFYLLRTLSTAANNSKSPVQVFLAENQNPFFNLATEDWLFREGDLSKRTLFLWRNAPTIVIGRNQNPYKECKLQDMEEQGVILTRRQSGGGAVYHDLGNTNFTFVSSYENYSKRNNTEIICRALGTFGVRAEASGRNDILVDGKKHGTLLINVDLGALGRLLNPNKEKLKSKGVASVQARVMNLQEANKEITHDSLTHAIIREFFKFYGSEGPIIPLRENELRKIPLVNKAYQQLQDWSWRFGETPEFQHTLETRFDWGTMDIHIDSQDGVITQVKVFSDSLYPSLVDAIQNALKGKRYDKLGVTEAVMEASHAMRSHTEEIPVATSKEYLADVERWLIKSL